MDKYTYAVVTEWPMFSDEQSYTYVRFPERLSFTQVDVFTRILKEIRDENKDNSKHTPWDNIYEALDRFSIEWGINGVIVDGCHGLITY